MGDDGSREVHGVAKDNGDLLATVREQGDCIYLDLHGFSTRAISLAKAKHLRRSLSRLIRRIEQREPQS